MNFFIDEGGHFTANAGISVLCSLAIPHALTDQLRTELNEFTTRWPRRDGELKGSLLSANHLAALVGVLFRYDALLQCIATDVSMDSQEVISAHKQEQCEGITRYLAPTHHPDFVAEVRALRSTLEAMPNQLYVQFVLLSDLVMAAAENAAMYFSQRRPQELSKFEWVIDAKDPKRVSTQEKWWRETIGPLGESKSRERPFHTFRHPGFDYSHLHANYSLEKDLWHPKRPREKIVGFDISKLVSRSVTFKDSRSDILLQAVDILANYVRRAFMSEVRDEWVIKNLGRLQILRRRDGNLQSIEWAAFDRQARPRASVGRVSRLMTRSGRSMIRDQDAI